MNSEGRDRAEALARKEYTAIEYRNRLVRMQNMDCLCHCSAEIDKGTLLYFSVNDMFLGQGVFVLLLFSEVSTPTKAQDEGQDVFSRMYTYAIVEEVAAGVLTGHYAFYSSELDGRLVLIINFPYGLMPDRSIVDYLDVNCRQIADRCREQYGMELVSYISEPIENIRQISAGYMRLLETATLDRYICRRFDDRVKHVFLPESGMEPPSLPSLQQNARKISNLLVNGEEWTGAIEQIMRMLANEIAINVENLKHLFGSYLDYLFQELSLMGVKLQEQDVRQSAMRMLSDSETWNDACRWMNGFLSEIAESRFRTQQESLREKLDAALACIDENYTDPTLTVERCALAAGCSVSALVKLFRRHLQMTVGACIRQKRLQEAERLLKQGCTVGETGERCGFGSTETFHRAFKAEYGFTPGRLSRTQKNLQ